MTEKTEEFELLSNEINKYQVLDREQERELFIDYKENGNMKAREKLGHCNLRLVVKAASKFCNMGFEMDYMDMIACGMEGLLHAIDKFDYKTGNRLITYCTPWIEQYIRRNCEQERKRKISMVYIDELEDEENFRYDQILDSSIEEKKYLSPEDQLMIRLREQDVDKALRQLQEVEQRVLRERFGFYSEPCTLSEIGKKLGKSKERIRQYEYQALSDLRRSECLEALKSYAA